MSPRNTPPIDPRNVLSKPSLGQAITIAAGWLDDRIIPRSRMLVVDAFAAPLAWALSGMSVASHVVWAMVTSCSTHFQRAGADVSLIPAALFALATWYSPPAGGLDGGQMPTFRVGSPYFALPVLAILGTTIWGYGDMLPFGSACR